MRFLSKVKSGVKYGALVDIGSASVLVAIVKSSINKQSPEVIWSKREYISLRENQTLDNNPKLVMTCLINALMLLDDEGKKALREKENVTKIPLVQVSLSAPWSKTVTKSISYSHDEDFRISEELVEELVRTSLTKATEGELNGEGMREGAEIIYAKSLQGLIANGYTLRKPNNQSAKSLFVIQSYASSQKYIHDTIIEAIEKVLPEAKVELLPFILLYYYVLRDLEPELTDYYLINISFEASEIAVIRDGLLKHTSFAPVGAYTLARQISNELKVPVDEAYSYLKEESPDFELKLYSKEKVSGVNKIFAGYIETMSNLFQDTGDELSIPKKIYLHDNLKTEMFFASQIEKAAKLRTKSSHATYRVTSLILDNKYSPEEKAKLEKTDIDTTLLLSAQFFHMELYQGRFD